MKTAFFVFLIIGAIGVQGYSECSYFQTSADLLKCAAANAETIKADNPYSVRSDDLELDGSGTQALVRVDCQCQYSLAGSNVLCDMDQSIERSSVIGAEKPAETCLRGRALCKEICPSRLP